MKISRSLASYSEDDDLAAEREKQQARKAVEDCRKSITACIASIGAESGFLGFFIRASNKPKYEFVLRIPMWFPIVALSLLLYREFVRVRSFGGRESPHCSKCYYMLAGNVSGICPECGTPIPEEVRKTLAAKEANTETGP